FFCINMY
ncbi:mitogen-activated protein kinase 4, partial [Phtheirospermum japonicum]